MIAAVMGVSTTDQGVPLSPLFLQQSPPRLAGPNLKANRILRHPADPGIGKRVAHSPRAGERQRETARRAGTVDADKRVVDVDRVGTVEVDVTPGRANRSATGLTQASSISRGGGHPLRPCQEKKHLP